MRELSIVEVQAVAGAGFLQNGLTSLGAVIGNAAYKALNSVLNIDVPGVGTINVGTLLPNLGAAVGSNIGNQVGGKIESGLSGLPIVGGLFSHLFK